MKRWVARTLFGLLVVLVVIQFIPYGRSHVNPPVRAEPAWDSPRTRELVRGACFDCHSNETQWRWSASVAPFSWIVQRNLDEGRRHLNFSEWDRPQPHAAGAVRAIEAGRMPPLLYRANHCDARLSDQERDELIDGLRRTMAVSATPPAADREEE